MSRGFEAQMLFPRHSTRYAIHTLVETAESGEYDESVVRIESLGPAQNVVRICALVPDIISHDMPRGCGSQR